MNLFSALPCELVYNGRTYKLKPYFDHVLQVFALFQREDLLQSDKLDLALFLLVSNKRVPRKHKAGLLNAIFDLLIEKQDKSEEPKSMDMVQDSALIYASFLQAYGLDLFDQQGRLHWTCFCALLQNLPSETPLMRVIDIRTKPVPKANKYNQKEIAQLLKLKAKYRLELSQEEREKQLQQGLAKIAMAMEAMKNAKG